MFELREKIVELLKNSGLPLDALIFIIKDVYTELISAYNASVENKEEGKNE